uniref:ABI family, member 3 (NESH) binding protein b n=1 Tax=Acanthochromis polyacanthus TaxID=80966 RepID=A0A3Q1GJN2_9TELE
WSAEKNLTLGFFCCQMNVEILLCIFLKFFAGIQIGRDKNRYSSLGRTFILTNSPEPGLVADAEPKYLVAVQPIPANDMKKHCTGKVNLEKPLHLVIGSVSPTAVLLSWGNHLKTPYDGNIMNECLEDGFYTIRYRERNRKWIYQTCPTSDTVIDNLKPNTPYEFGVRSNKDDQSGMWSKPVVHNTNMASKVSKTIKLNSSCQKKLQLVALSPEISVLLYSVAPDKGNSVRTDPDQPVDLPTPALPHFLPTKAPPTTTTPLYKIPSDGEPLPVQTTKTPSSEPEKNQNTAGKSPNFPFLLLSPFPGSFMVNNINVWCLKQRCFISKTFRTTSASSCTFSTKLLFVFTHLPPCFSEKSPSNNKVNNLKQTDKLPILKPKVPAATAKPTKPERKHTTTVAPATAGTGESWEDSDLFKSQPTSDVDALGKKRFVAPHVVYQTGKKPEEPCSITSSLNYFPEAEPGETNVTSPPRTPPSNLTVVTVEGCPSFIILDWEKTDNDTTEYEVISTAKGPDGEQVSILTTNQTHTAVENLKPESSYEFKVKPKNELGAGPPSEPVSFNTESADPRVSENVSGKDAIWTQFPFKTDSYSDCHGKQYVKRTWYRKFVGVQLCNSLRYKIYLSDSLNGKFYNIGDQTGFGEDHCQFVDSFLDGRTGRQLRADQLPNRPGFYRAVRQEPVHFGQIGGHSHVNYVSWYECGTPIPGKW